MYDNVPIGAAVAPMILVVLVPLFVFEMDVADSLLKIDVITMRERSWLCAISVFKIPLVGFCTIFVPVAGIILFGVTTAISVLLIFLGWRAWKKAKRPS